MMESPYKPFSYNLERLYTFQAPMFADQYQRDFAWEDDEVEDFIDDVQRTMARRRDEPHHDHFFGAVVAIRHSRDEYPNPNFEIVDGQQRLTTFTLAIAALIHGAEVLEPRLEPAQQDALRAFANAQRDAFLWKRETPLRRLTEETARQFVATDRDEPVLGRIVSGEDPAGIVTDEHPAERDSHRLLCRAANRLRDELVVPLLVDDTAIAIDNLTRLRDTLAYGSEFIFIWTDSHQNAHRLFAALNDRGRRLEEADHLRTYTLMLTRGADKSVKDRIASSWDKIDRYPRAIVDAFLRHHFASVYGERLSSNSIAEAYRERVFGGREDLVSDEDASHVALIVEDLAASVALYQPISQGDWPFVEVTGKKTPRWDRDRLFRLVRVLGSDRVLPLLLAAASRGRSDFASIVPELERIEFRALLSSIEQNRMANMYFDVAAMLRAGWVDVPGAIGELQAWAAKWADDGRFNDGMKDRLIYGTQKSTNQIKHLLTTVDDHFRWLDAGAVGRPRARKATIWDWGEVEDEHIYPQHPSGGLPSALQEHVHLLGNQAFWGPGDNKRKEASNNLPTSKAKTSAYLTADAELTRRVGRQLEALAVWGAPEIEARGDALRDLAQAIYALPETARIRAASLGRSRPAAFRHRELGARKVWLVLDSPGSPFEAIGSVGHRVSTRKYVARDIVPGDIVLAVRPRERQEGAPTLPARVTSVGVVNRLEFSEGDERQLGFAAESRLLLAEGVSLATLDPGSGAISLSRPVTDGNEALAALTLLLGPSSESDDPVSDAPMGSSVVPPESDPQQD